VVARKTLPDKKPKVKKRIEHWACLGFDISYSSLAGACVVYDAILRRLRGPSTIVVRWTKEDAYLKRMAEVARAENFVHDLLSGFGCNIGEDRIFVAVEEPWPAHSGFTKRMNSSYLLQQAEMSGAFRGGLARYGYRNHYQVGVKMWRAVVAAEMEMKQNKEFDKFTVKRWAREAFEIPDWPDLIGSPHGKIPKPKTSRAKPLQPDDRYDALGVMAYMQTLVEEQLDLSA
jgi:hypothetical protein